MVFRCNGLLLECILLRFVVHPNGAVAVESDSFDLVALLLYAGMSHYWDHLFFSASSSMLLLHVSLFVRIADV
jgi:hypothetical protein